MPGDKIKPQKTKESMGGNCSSFNLRGIEVSRKRGQTRAVCNLEKQNRYKQSS